MRDRCSRQRSPATVNRYRDLLSACSSGRSGSGSCPTIPSRACRSFGSRRAARLPGRRRRARALRRAPWPFGPPWRSRSYRTSVERARRAHVARHRRAARHADRDAPTPARGEGSRGAAPCRSTPSPAACSSISRRNARGRTIPTSGSSSSTTAPRRSASSTPSRRRSTPSEPPGATRSDSTGSRGTGCGTRSRAGSSWPASICASVAELGGWKTLSMVQRYAHLAPRHLQDAVGRSCRMAARHLGSTWVLGNRRILSGPEESALTCPTLLTQSRGGETGIRGGLKIRYVARRVRVRLPPPAPMSH